MLRLGVIGCGRVTTMFHLRAIRDVAEVEVAAVSDVDEEQMKTVARECGAKAYADYRELLQDPEIDGVAINTPPRFHEEMVLDALDSGKNVLCEKPLSESVEGYTKIKEAQHESGLAVLPAHNYAFTPCLTRLTDLIDSGTIGGVRKLTLAFMNNLKTYRPQTDFRTMSSTGVIMDVLPHILSVSTQVAGAAVDVKELRWWCDDYQVCDNMETTLVTERGVDLECNMSWTKLVPRFGVEIHGFEQRLNGILTKLRGDRTVGKRQDTMPPSINRRVRVAMQWYVTSAPTQTQRDAYEHAATEFAEVLADLRGLMEEDLTRLEEKLEAAGAPWTPGRIPDWEKE